MTPDFGLKGLAHLRGGESAQRNHRRSGIELQSHMSRQRRQLAKLRPRDEVAAGPVTELTAAVRQLDANGSRQRSKARTTEKSQSPADRDVVAGEREEADGRTEQQPPQGGCRDLATTSQIHDRRADEEDERDREDEAQKLDGGAFVKRRGHQSCSARVAEVQVSGRDLEIELHAVLLTFDG
jgi:hypothetical protein